VYCDEIENLFDDYMRSLEEIQYKLYLSPILASSTFSQRRRRTSLRMFKWVNSILERIGLHISLKENYYKLLARTEWAPSESEDSTNLKAHLGSQLFLNQRAAGLIWRLAKDRSRYVEACESFADDLSKKMYVDNLKSIISFSLGLNPCMLLKHVKCLNPRKLSLERKGIRKVGRGEYMPLFDVQGKFMIENLSNLIKEVMVAENYKDEVHGIVLPSKSLLYIDVGAFLGENVAWTSLYSEDSMAYAIEALEQSFKIMRYNLTSDNRVGKWLRERNFQVRLIKEYINSENRLDKLISEQDLGRYNTLILKSDIEGAERELLRGSTTLLKEHKPVLTIAAYHRGDDLFVLPELILRSNDGYKLYFKPYNYFSEFILFAK